MVVVIEDSWSHTGPTQGGIQPPASPPAPTHCGDGGLKLVGGIKGRKSHCPLQHPNRGEGAPWGTVVVPQPRWGRSSRSVPGGPASSQQTSGFSYVVGHV